ncbi:uncharacterized protein KY384_004623 [Bacidia gigantensis]|uniref:uncharacterized protein n=1 Tax=Bacidia gigantensis TaxID=2732470 RepID=UPI001D056770|nr:uncharacterized protein KY384_004623 [Bacidia gigantensis]KAG8531265.1 hypothetical protein KY384_004623 [Bacidia gigantensis]
MLAITTFFQRWTLGVRDASTAVNANIPKILEILEYPGLKSALTSGLASLAQQTENNLQVTNDALLSNVTDFEAFASHGNFSTAPSPVADITKYLTFAFNTYIASDALNTNNILAIVARDTNPVALASNGTQLAYPLDCKSYNAQNRKLPISIHARQLPQPRGKLRPPTDRVIQDLHNRRAALRKRICLQQNGWN